MAVYPRWLVAPFVPTPQIAIDRAIAMLGLSSAAGGGRYPPPRTASASTPKSQPESKAEP